MVNSIQSDSLDFKVRKQLETCVKRTMSSLEHENTIMAASPAGAFQRLLKVYKGLKPVLGFLTGLRVLPLPAQTGISLLAQALEAVSQAGPQLTAQFKAGKDIEAEA